MRADSGSVTILGIVNITPDSFSDGGRFLQPGRAVEHALKLDRGGADIIDLGPASSHPDSRPVSAQEEWTRLEPVLKSLKAKGLRLSVDSFLPETQLRSAQLGVEILNDTRGFAHPAIYPQLAELSCDLVVMHSVQGLGRASRVSTEADRVFEGALEFLQGRVDELTSAGISRERLILDPGMGFFLGSRPEPSLRMLERLPELRQALGLPLLVSVSRKSFLGGITGKGAADRGSATLAAELFAVLSGSDYVRTHDAAALRDALRVWDALGALRTARKGSSRFAPSGDEAAPR